MHFSLIILTLSLPGAVSLDKAVIVLYVIRQCLRTNMRTQVVRWNQSAGRTGSLRDIGQYSCTAGSVRQYLCYRERRSHVECRLTFFQS